MSEIVNMASVETVHADDTSKVRLIAAGGLFGAIATSTCCIVPLLLFSLGIGGAWIGQLTALSAYQPIFMSITFGFLGYGYWLVYRKPKVACAEGEACAKPLPNLLVKAGLWLSTALIMLAVAWPYLIPLILG